MKPLEKPPEWEGDDSVNAPEELPPVEDKDLDDTEGLDEDDD